ncbi:hypothetical protein N2152v2_002946 [Parachlorella kessleri]
MPSNLLDSLHDDLLASHIFPALEEPADWANFCLASKKCRQLALSAPKGALRVSFWEPAGLPDEEKNESFTAFCKAWQEGQRGLGMLASLPVHSLYGPTAQTLLETAPALGGLRHLEIYTLAHEAADVSGILRRLESLYSLHWGGAGARALNIAGHPGLQQLSLYSVDNGSAITVIMGTLLQRFLPYLPPNAAGEDAVSSSDAVDAIQEDLEWLLASDGATLWSVVRTDTSLPALVDSYLRYARRPYDDAYAETSAAELAVHELMLALLHRCGCGQEPGAPAGASQRAALLSFLLDIPKVLDLCSLYSASHPAQLRELLEALFQLQPGLGPQLTASAATVAANVGQVVDACLAAAGQAGRDAGMLQSVLDGVEYLRDVCLTLCALLAAFLPAAGLMLSRDQSLLESVATLHDSLVPAVARLASRSIGNSSNASSSMPNGGLNSSQVQLLHRYCLHLEVACERAVVLLLAHAYLEPAEAPAQHSGHSRGADSGQQSRGMPAAARFNPAQRGEALLHAVMLLGHREEEAKGLEGFPREAGSALGGLPLAQALALRHGFGGAVETALLCHAVALDDAQCAYLAALLGLASLAEAPVPLPAGHAEHAGVAAQRGGAAVAAAGVESAVLASQISQIKDLLPDYGEGYLAVCLDAYDSSPERVIDALLGGALYPQLEDLDPHMTLQQYQERCQRRQSAPSMGAGAADKGKRPVGEPAAASSTANALGTGESRAGLAGAAVASSSASSGGGRAAVRAAGSAAGAAAGGASKPRPESKTAKYLDVREETYRDSLISTATALQWEYDDEYDDSFDDLINYTADGVTEAEGDDDATPAARIAGASRGGGPTAGAPRQGSGQQAGPPAAAVGVAAAQRAMQGLGLGPSRPREQQGLGVRAPGPGSAGTAGPPAPGAGQQPQRPPQHQEQGGPGRRQGKRGVPAGRLWVLDGRIYNYPKPGAKEVASREEAEQQLEAAQQATQEIYGLGPGGNKPLPAGGAQQWRRQQQADAAGEAAAEGTASLQQQEAQGAGEGAGGGRQGPILGPGAGGGRGRASTGSAGRGSGRGGDAGARYKDQHKASVANHHRKDRALKKAGGGYSGPG